MDDQQFNSTGLNTIDDVARNDDPSQENNYKSEIDKIIDKLDKLSHKKLDDENEKLSRVHKSKRRTSKIFDSHGDDSEKNHMHHQSYDLNIDVSDDECQNFPTGTDHESFTASRENLIHLSNENLSSEYTNCQNNSQKKVDFEFDNSEEQNAEEYSLPTVSHIGIEGPPIPKEREQTMTTGEAQPQKGILVKNYSQNSSQMYDFDQLKKDVKMELDEKLKNHETIGKAALEQIERARPFLARANSMKCTIRNQNLPMTRANTFYRTGFHNHNQNRNYEKIPNFYHISDRNENKKVLGPRQLSNLKYDTEKIIQEKMLARQEEENHEKDELQEDRDRKLRELIRAEQRPYRTAPYENEIPSLSQRKSIFQSPVAPFLHRRSKTICTSRFVSPVNYSSNSHIKASGHQMTKNPFTNTYQNFLARNYLAKIQAKNEPNNHQLDLDLTSNTATIGSHYTFHPNNSTQKVAVSGANNQIGKAILDAIHGPIGSADGAVVANKEKKKKMVDVYSSEFKLTIKNLIREMASGESMVVHHENAKSPKNKVLSKNSKTSHPPGPDVSNRIKKYNQVAKNLKTLFANDEKDVKEIEIEKNNATSDENRAYNQISFSDKVHRFNEELIKYEGASMRQHIDRSAARKRLISEIIEQEKKEAMHVYSV